MKLCNKCGIWKDESEFAWKLKAEGTRNSQCKECHKGYSKVHYGENLDSYKKKARLANEKAVARNKEYIVKYLLEHPCVDCGESDIEVLQFDHKELVGNKGRRVGSYMNGSLLALKREIDKCEPRCANCHVKRTRQQLGWFRAL